MGEHAKWHVICNYKAMNTSPDHDHTTPARILFVDDSKMMRLAGRKILESQYHVVLAACADEASAVLDQNPDIAVIFSDLNMPDRSGYELLQEVRASTNRALRRLAVIIMTGSDNQEQEREAALQAGATDFINKPFRASELLARARTHVASFLATRQLNALRQTHHRDLATGLGNRNYCTLRLEQAMSFARRHRQPLSLLYLHLKGLEQLMDSLGEPYAGNALGKIGRVLNQSIRREDMVFRTGSESFCFMLPATAAAGARVVRDRFIPDLESLGLRVTDYGLNVCRQFAIQEPDLSGESCAERVLREGLAQPTATAGSEIARSTTRVPEQVEPDWTRTDSG
jgi:two-component system, cell cycle response regulator